MLTHNRLVPQWVLAGAIQDPSLFAQGAVITRQVCAKRHLRVNGCKCLFLSQNPPPPISCPQESPDSERSLSKLNLDGAPSQPQTLQQIPPQKSHTPCPCQVPLGPSSTSSPRSLNLCSHTSFLTLPGYRLPQGLCTALPSAHHPHLMFSPTLGLSQGLTPGGTR